MGTAILPGSRVGGEVVRAVNGLTGRWAATARDGTVLSAAGVWPLPAFLADGATGPARAEPSEALGLSADQAAGAARQLPGAPAGLPGVGFLALHRHSRLVPAAVQVTDPLPFPERPDEGCPDDEYVNDAWGSDK
jgi:hypothetical protein